MISNSIKICFRNDRGLGDKVATLFLLENLGIQTRAQSFVSGPTMDELCKTFYLEFVTFREVLPDAIPPHALGVGSNFGFGHPEYVCYLMRLLTVLIKSKGFTTQRLEALRLRRPVLQFRDEVCAQFDGRFSRRMGYPMILADIKHFIFKYANGEPITIVGGIDTERYLGTEWNYYFSSAENLIYRIFTASRFLGCDSGMAHVAGALGKSGQVKMLIPMLQLEQVYSLYPKIRIIP